MTKLIASSTSASRYFLTIDEAGHATDCSCKDRRYRHHECKHITAFNSQLAKGEMFASLKVRYDMRSQAVCDAKRTAYLNFEMSLGL